MSLIRTNKGCSFSEIKSNAYENYRDGEGASKERIREENRGGVVYGGGCGSAGERHGERRDCGGNRGAFFRGAIPGTTYLGRYGKTKDF